MRSPDLMVELRAGRPVASPELRERVRAVGANAPAPRRSFAVPSLGRLGLAAAAAAVAVGVGFAGIHGLTHSNRPVARSEQPRPQPVGVAGGGASSEAQKLLPADAAKTRGAFTGALRGASALPVTPSRLQQYGASLRVQVKDREDLSDATKRALRVARLLGGYVASVHYSAPRRGVGAATIVVRVPIDRVADAIEEYSGLGTLLRQKLTITDVTKAVQEQAKEIARLRAEIRRLEAGGVTPAERYRLDEAKARLDYLTKRKHATVRRAQLARVSLELTTKPKSKAAAASRFDRTLSDAGGVLVREAEILLYALIVAGPLLLLGAAAVGAARLGQRRREAQLLERS